MSCLFYVLQIQMLRSSDAPPTTGANSSMPTSPFRSQPLMPLPSAYSRSGTGCSPALHSPFTSYVCAFSSFLLEGYRVSARIVLANAHFVSRLSYAHPRSFGNSYVMAIALVSRDAIWMKVGYIRSYSPVYNILEGIQTIMKR